MPIHKEDKLVNCETCHHFTGSALWHRFGCAKDHQQENSFNFKRLSCPDNKQMTTDELIFERFKFTAKSYGDQDLKKHQALIRRLVTGLRSAASEHGFGKFLDLDQLTTIKEATDALALLGDRIERAGRLAKRYQKEEQEKYERERHQRLSTVSADYFGEASEDDVLEVCEDLCAFEGQEGKKWFRAHSTTGEGWVELYLNTLEGALAKHRSHPNESTLVKIRLIAAEYLEELQKSSNRCDVASLQDFEDFRKYRAEQQQILASVNVIDISSLSSKSKK